MQGHLRANLWLLVLTVLVCCVLYPLAVWAVGRTVFRHEAEGSLIAAPDGKTVGSRLIAQHFTGAEYFQPRPSAVAYNAAASGGSNWGANNPKLRDRVARTIGPIARYADGPRKGERVGPDVEKWFAERTDPAKVPAADNLVTAWARDYPTLAAFWVSNAPDEIKTYIKEWANSPDHKEVLREWRKDNPDASGEPKVEDLAAYFFPSFARAHPGKWLALGEVPAAGGKMEKKVQLVTEDSDVQATFFNLWWQAVHADPKGVPPRLGHVPQLEQIPADLVMASGSGLDPHITLRNAEYQRRRVVEARAKKAAEALEKKEGKPLPPARREELAKRIRQQIDELLEKLSAPPMGALAIAGEEKIVNVLELNLALDKRP
jgi:potassium-transporting ATPase KdpC subunit